MLSVVLLLVPEPGAAGGQNYRYDARGRLVEVRHVSGPSAGVVVGYAHDRADNRTRVVTTGAPNGAPLLAEDGPPPAGQPASPP